MTPNIKKIKKSLFLEMQMLKVFLVKIIIFLELNLFKVHYLIIKMINKAFFKIIIHKKIKVLLGYFQIQIKVQFLINLSQIFLIIMINKNSLIVVKKNKMKKMILKKKQQ